MAGPRLAHLVAALLVVITGCAGPALAPPETFDWSEQPITFAAPPAGWRREGDLSGGRRGIRFVKERSVGEAISVTEYYLVGDRDRRGTLKQLLARIDAYDERSLRRALQQARCRTDQPLNALEGHVAQRVNAALDRATMAQAGGDPESVRAAIGDALLAAEAMQLSLRDVVDRVAFHPERTQEPGRYQIIARRETQIAGGPAAVVDYTVQVPERLFHAREVYLVHDNHVFVLSFIGLKQNLALFDRVVASITWPPRTPRAAS